jgi:hypothetical protein
VYIIAVMFDEEGSAGAADVDGPPFDAVVLIGDRWLTVKVWGV